MSSYDSEIGNENGCKSRWAYVIATLGALLIVVAMVYAVRKYTQAPPLGQARAIERAQKLAELRGEEVTVLNEVAWVDKDKGIVRLPIATAMDLMLRKWQNPPAARSNLIDRVEKANYVPPPPPAKPSPFE
jgi:hypothetical protein